MRSLEKLSFGKGSAELEKKELSKYFLRTPEFEELSKGETCLVIGGKGTGKSVLRQMLERQTNDPQVIYRSVPLAPVSTSELPTDSVAYQRAHQLVCQYVLLSQALNELENHDQSTIKKAVKEARKVLGEVGLSPTDQGLRVEQATYGFEFMGAKTPSITLGREKTVKQDHIGAGQSDVESALSRALGLVNAALASADIEIRLLVDKTDEGWNASLADRSRLRGLLAAVHSMWESDDRGIVPIAFIRSDVWEWIEYQDLDHFQSSTIWLKWEDSQLMELLRLRINASLGTNFASSEDAFAHCFADYVSIDEEYALSYDGSPLYIPAWRFIRRSIPARPRDLIQFLNKAREARNRIDPQKKIGDSHLKEAEKKYSAVRYQNIVQAEGFQVAPNLARITSGLKGADSILTWVKFKLHLTGRQSMLAIEAESQLRSLIRYDVCGLWDNRADAPIYYSEDARIISEPMSPVTIIVVHPGLRYHLGTTYRFLDKPRGV